MNANRRTGFGALLLIMAAAQLLPLAASGHVLEKDFQKTSLLLSGSKITVKYETTYSDARSSAEFILADKDRDGVVSEFEEKLFLKNLSRDVLSKLTAIIDDSPVDLNYVRGASTIRAARPLIIQFVYKITLNSIAKGTHALILRDDNVSRTSTHKVEYFVDDGSGVKSKTESSHFKVLEWRFHYPGRQRSDPELNVGNPVASPSAPIARERSRNRFSELIHQKDLSRGVVVLALMTAMFLGAFHALSPGHGKSMVAAYLVGTKGRIKDAVALGLIVTVSHVASVFILGLVALALTRFIIPAVLYPWLELVSGCLVLAVGCRMLAKHFGARSSHAGHHHTHSHDHSHERVTRQEGGADKEKPTPGLLTLGFSAGMVPCPSALAVLLASIALHRIAFGLFLILAFSVGLAATLVAIGVLTVAAADFMSKSIPENRYLKHLPLLSAGIVVVIGLLMIFKVVFYAR